MGPSRFRFVALVAALTVVASACFGGGGGSATRPKPRGGSSNSNDPGCQSVAASTLTRTVAPRVDKTEYLVDASAQSTVCYDRITFVFQPGDAANLPPNLSPSVFPPSYIVQYKQPPFAPNINKTSTESLSGVHAILEVIFQPASTTDVRKGSGVQTYRGNLRLQIPTGLRHTLIVEQLDQFPQLSPDPNASVMVWLIGLDSKRPFTTQSAIAPGGPSPLATSSVSILIPD